MKPSHEEIKQRAFEIWEREGRVSGRDAEHWFQAEAELIAERQKNESEKAFQNGRRENPELTSKDPSMLKTPKRRKAVMV